MCRTLVNNLTSNIDLFPTILELLKIKYNLKIDGQSFSSLKTNQFRKYIIAEIGWFGSMIQTIFSSRIKISEKKTFNNYLILPKQCIRDENYKLIKYYDGNKELYDIKKILKKIII
ncbi:MAG: hypothetical protein ACTSRP_22265 [Candidatus Helarchaeota archaeon]